MKTLISCLIVLSVKIYGFDEIKQSAKINAVTVFQSKAQIIANAKVNVLSGNNTVIIDNVASQIEPQTIQVTGKGDVVILGVKYINEYLNGVKTNSKLNLLKDSLSYLQDDQKLLDLNHEAIEREKDLLKANYGVGNQQIGTTADKVKEMADFFRNRMADINGKLIKLSRQKSNIALKIAKFQNQIEEENQRNSVSNGQIIITVSAKTKTMADLEITYITNSAGWSPSYDIRAKDTKSAINFNFKANVWQQTGIDWKDVKIKLSTTNPNQNNIKPELNPQLVDIYNPAKYMPSPVMSRAKSAGLEVTQLDEVAVVGYGDIQTAADFVTMNQNALSVSYEIGIPYTVLTGGKPQIVDVQNYEIPANYIHFAVPKIDQDVFLLAQIAGWEQYSLMPAAANIYFENTFIGETYIQPNSVTDTLSLSLGRDKKINLKRENIKDFSSKKFIGSNIREGKAYRITIRNTKKESVFLTLEDQIPISKDNTIEIEDKMFSGAAYNAETGKLTWKVQLNPAESKSVEVKFIVKYPKGKTIIGL